AIEPARRAAHLAAGARSAGDPSPRPDGRSRRRGGVVVSTRPRDEGTPRSRRSSGYQRPSERKIQLVMFSSVAALVLFIGALLLYVGGARQTLSPGAVASHHARVD